MLVARPFDLELDRSAYSFNFVDLNNRLNIRVVRNVSHDDIAVRRERFLEGVYRIESQVCHRNERGL